MATTATTTTTQVPTSSYHDVPVRDVEYSKEQYATAPGTAYMTQPYTQPAQTYSQPGTGYSNYQQLSTAVPNVSIFLRPIAAPSALGWMAFFGGTFMLFTYYANWYGGDDTYVDIAPFIFTFGGICQLIAGFYGYNARDNFATVWFPLWGAFFLAWGWYEYYALSRKFTNVLPGTDITLIPIQVRNDGLGMWFVIMTAVSWACFIPSLGRDIITAGIVFLAAVGCTLEMAFFSNKNGERASIKAGAYFLLFSGILALFRGFLYLLEEAFYDTPLYNRMVPKYRTPWAAEKAPVVVGVNEPGVKKTQ